MAKKRAGVPRFTAKQALVAANRYILFHYPTMYTGAMPRRLVLRDTQAWVVPIVLTHPERGILGDVGFIAVDAAGGAVLGATPRAEVVAAGKKLLGAKRDDSEAAILNRHFPSRFRSHPYRLIPRCSRP